MHASEPRVEIGNVVGKGLDRVDGAVKVTGAAPYPTDFSYPRLAHASLVRSTIAAGRIRHMDIETARAMPGVLHVITHNNALRIARGPEMPIGEGVPSLPSPPAPLQDDRSLHYGQFVAVVIAETAEQAIAAAGTVQVDYEETEALLSVEDTRAELLTNPYGMDMRRGDVGAAFEAAEVQLVATYTTADNTNNPMGLFSTIAFWDGDSLTIHDSTQGPTFVRVSLAKVFGIPEERIRVIAPFVGGGFGAGTRVWPHVILAALAARMVDRPVKLVLTRPQMFTAIGHRPNSIQHLRVGMTRAGELVSIEHESTSSVAMEDSNLELVAFGTAGSYACPNVVTRDQQVRLNIPCPGSMRAPGSAEGNFALESALDELSYIVGIDPLELRLRNYAEVEPQFGLPWSSKALRECFVQGADRIGWSQRNPEPRSMRDGHWLVGYGMAGVTFHWYQQPCQARATLYADGHVVVRSAAADIGNGTYTVMTQLAADALGLPLQQVRFELGDSDMPMAPQAGGSGLTVSLGPAVHAVCSELIHALLELSCEDVRSPLHGSYRRDEVTVSNGRLHLISDPERGEAFSDILARCELPELTVDSANTLTNPMELGLWPAGAFAAHFVEVRVDPDFGLVRVSRVVTAIDGGRILNEKLARSQIIGSVVGGIGMALLEETMTDAGSGRIANATFADYLVPVNADIPDLDVIFVGEPDPIDTVGAKGIGEVGLVGIAAAVANAVYHASGVRVRDLPIVADRLL